MFVGPLDVTYTYDNLYQLRSMSAKYRAERRVRLPVVGHLTYDETGNIKTKAQSQDRLVWDNQTVNTNDTNPVVTQLAGSRFDHNAANLTYSLAYQYTGPRPHAATAINETPGGSTLAHPPDSYDANGNNTGNTFQLNKRKQIWDEESRLKEVTRTAALRAVPLRRQRRADEEVHSWFQCRRRLVREPVLRAAARQPPTKHIFAGDTRIVTKTDAIIIADAGPPLLPPGPPRHDQLPADKDQNLVQHERYFAFGELWRGGEHRRKPTRVAPIGDRRDWLFTSKEWDVDTELYYFGARYFDPHTTSGKAPTPSSRVTWGKASGASSKNLNLYSYAWNNPIVLRDPDGRQLAGTVRISLRCGYALSSKSRLRGPQRFRPMHPTV